MRKWLRRLGLAVALVGVASIVALYSYGRFAEGARGPAAYALPTAADATELDRAVAPLLRERGRQSGMALLSDNLDAFAVRAATARAAGRSLDLHAGVVILAVTGGGSLFGIIGAFLAVPVVAVATTLVRYLRLQLDEHARDPEQAPDVPPHERTEGIP